jgi:hypothetical protein
MFAALKVPLTFQSNINALEYTESVGRGSSGFLADTPWPSDHGDSSRSKFTIGAGLPANVTASDLKRIDLDDVEVQWIYTGGANNEYLYTMGGQGLKGVILTKFDSVSLEILQTVTMQKCFYIGGFLMHKNGHAYFVQCNRLMVFWNGKFILFKNT